MRRRLLALTVVSFLLFGAAACGDEAGDGPGSSSSSADAGDQITGLTVEGEVGNSMDVTLDEKITTDSARTEVLTTGEGNPVKPNESALLHLYIGNGTSGDQAINTYEQGPPVQVSMSEDQLFKPVLDALVGKPGGSRVAVAAPAKEVWGAQGAPQLNLKAADTAVFVADVVSVQPAEVIDGPQGAEVDPEKDAPRVLEKNGKVTGFDWSSAPDKAPKELTVIPLVEGDGPVAKPESMVTFDYFGAVYGKKEPFDESYSREPVPFGVGVNGLIPAWDKSIPGLERGSRVLIIAPPEEGYGSQARPGIPADSTLVFVVDVLGVDA